eukprot:GFUD01107555.1.p1 GENE.GFUD01107555.1~~GFUD01107555.1.p1  ORF type:complete len:1977 (-),score=508.72 GFUD01107555.1:283-6213(-)
MLRPSFPGGVPYPPRPGEAGHPSGGVRYAAVYPPGGQPGQPQPAQYTQRGDGQVFVRQPPADSRAAERGPAGARMTLRQAPYPIYQEYRDGVQVLGVGRGDQVHVVAPPTSLPGMHPHPQLGVGGVSHADVTSASKRPRMGPGESLAPLRIDTTSVKEPGYHPQVEAISPTPEDRTAERDDVRSTKDDLLQKISKVDREIAKAESQIAKLKKKQHDLEDAANRPTSDSASEEAAVNQSIAQNVYSENRRKAGQSHASLEKFSAKNDLPLYNQPSDTEVYSTNKKNYTVFKKKLVEYFKKSQSEREARDRYLTVTYCKLTSQWTKKVDRVENSRKRKEREGRSREMYEKIFPELRKQREDKERDARLGTRGVVKSDADFEDVIERLQEQEVRLKMEDKKMHSYAVIPPLLLPPDERRRKFTNTNGLIQDPMLIYNERKYVNMWTDQERETFKEKYLQHPKNFGLIAQYLERKTVSDCVQYYYLSKKTENYKQLLRKSRTRPRGQRRAQAPTGEVIGPGIQGVVTRRKVEELQGKEQLSGENNSKGNSRSNTPAPLANNVKTEENGEASGGEKENGKKKPDRARDSKKTENQNDSSDDEESNQAVKTGPHPCVLCKAVVDSSRAVAKSHSVQLGLTEEELVNDARVCNSCWCKTLKKKHAAVCPIPACTSSKGRNRGKLRHLPSKWADLDSQSKETIVGELQLPENTKRVCTACFTRITRRISQLEGVSGEVKKEKDEPVNWSEEEIENARESLRNHGTNWGRMAETVKVKTEEQCKKFFYNQRKRLQLDKLVTEYKRATRPEGSDKPSLTSDEESGSTTSSCEEDPALTIDTDAQAAPKQDPDLKPPAVPPVSESKPEPENNKKVEEGYDSSATMSADETGEPAGAPAKPRQVGPPVPAGVVTTCRPNNMPMTVNDLMETVISHTLQTQTGSDPNAAVSVAPVVVTTAPPRTDIPSLNHLLQESGPSPTMRNYVKEALPVARNMAGKEPPTGTSPGLPPISRPDLEVRPVPPQPAPHQPVTDVLDLTVSRPDRSSPAPSAPGPSDHPSYPGFSKLVEPRPETIGMEPPAAHGGPKAKTTHMEMMMQDPTFPHLFRKDNKSPAPYTNPRTSVHSPGPQLVHRDDPRKDLNPKSQPPPLHPNKSLATHPGLQITPSQPSRGGSLVHGTPHGGAPKAQPGHPGPPLQHSPSTYDGRAPHRGSIQSGIPVYNNKQTHHGPPTRPQEPGRSSHPAMDAYKQGSPAYPPYQSPRPASLPHEPPPSGAPLISSSRRIIEADYTIAQTLPRKDPRDQGSGFPRVIDPHRRDPGDPRNNAARFPTDSRNAVYGTQPRFPFGGRGDSIRGDPRADIPGRDPNVRGDPREMYRQEPRLPVDPRDARADPRAMMDPRGRPPYPGYDPRMPHHARDAGRRSPPRTMPSNMVNSHHPGIPPQPSGRGSITQGLPKRDVDIYSPRHPEVSITKQPSAGTREYQNTSLSDLAEVAASQQRITDGRDHRQNPPNAASRADAGPSRGPAAVPMMDPRVYDPRVRADMEKQSAQLGPPRVPSRERGQISEQEERERQHRNMMMKFNQMSDSEKQQYLTAMTGVTRGNSDQMTASHLIDLIITHQINKNTVAGPGQQNPRRSPQAVGDGKESPSKAPSRSPSVKSMTERDGMDGASGSAIRTSPGTMGEHIENMINKEVNRNSTTSPYPGPSNSSENHEHWKRRGYPPDQAAYSQARPPSQPRPPSNSHPQLSTDERQILRVAQNASPRPDKPPSRSSMHEAISPPTSEPGRGHPSHPSYYPPQQDQAMARFLAARRKQEAEAAAAAAAKSGFGVSHFMDDYVKHKITEVMKNEKAGGAGPSDLSSKPSSHGGPMGPPHKRPLEVEARGSPSEHPSGNSESPRKRYKQDEAGGSNTMPDSPESGEGDMVIDESARPDSAHSHKTNSPAPNADPSHYPPGYRGGVPPPRSSPAPAQGSRPPPQNPVALARYEPLSDDD